MAFTVEQKSQLAKLMATENLRVEHQKISTAKFDTKNRVLYLPIWQNMTGTLYDLLCGHEVGHALYTPPEGWHDVVSDKSKGRNYKSFLNVVEDARIEKKVKRKYPGLKPSFQTAYSELMKRNFFGINDRNINDMPFIDRLNLYSKSQWSATWIQFTNEETFMVDKVQNAETWADVLRITEEIYEYSKDEQFEMATQMNDFEFAEDEYGDGDYDIEEGDGGDLEESDGGEETKNDDAENTKESDKADKKQEKKTQANSSKKDDEAENDESDEDDSDGEANRFKDSQESDFDQYDPECVTDDSFREKESLLLDEKCKPYVYVNLPKPILKNIITPAKRVQEQLTNFYKYGVPTSAYVSDRKLPLSEATKWVNEFKQKNERYVGLLAKEFEMRKAAKAFSKSKLSDTGDIDIGKLAGYKFDDNIFRKVMLTPKGKNHGLVLLLDKSGSMSKNMAGSIEQILVLTMFCRKVNIPFVVYGFGDSAEAHIEDLGIKHNEEERLRYTSEKHVSFEEKDGNIYFGTVRLREYLNSSMSNVEYTQSMRNMIILKKSYEYEDKLNIQRPESEHLSNTPLTQAIYACGYIMKDFRKRFNLDLCSLIIIHDGDADNTSSQCVMRERTISTGEIRKWTGSERLYTGGTNVVVRDYSNKFETTLSSDYNVYDSMNAAVLTWFKQTTGAKVFGFFLMGTDRYHKNTLINRYVSPEGQTLSDLRKDLVTKTGAWIGNDLEVQLVKKFKSEKFIVSYPHGFNSFFFVLGGNDLKTEEEEIEIDGKVTSSKLKTAFMKFNKKKALNRVLVSKFIQGIAA
jgi:hypothetical protein